MSSKKKRPQGRPQGTPQHRPQPQDHQPKQTKPKVKEVDGRKQVTFPTIVRMTRAGKPVLDGEKNPVPLTVTVPTEALNDFELLDDARAVDVEQNASRLPGLLRRLVGDDYQAVMDSHRDAATGRVPIEPVASWMRSLMEALDPNS